MPEIERGLGRQGLRLVGKQHLPQFALLGRLKIAAARLILRLELIGRHGDRRGDVIETQHRQGEAAPLFGAESIQMGVVKRGELRVGRRRRRRDGTRRQGHDVGDAALGARAVEGVDQWGGRSDPVGDRTGELAADHVVAQRILELRLGELIGGQKLRVLVAVEAARRPLEIGIEKDRVTHRLVADRKPEPVGFEIDEIAADDLLQGVVNQSELFCLLGVDVVAKRRVQLRDLFLHGLIDLIGPDLDVADLGDIGIDSPIAEDVADSPQPEGRGQKGEQHLDDEAIGFGADGLQHGADDRSPSLPFAIGVSGAFCWRIKRSSC